jgi:hypothetical protein
MQFGFKLIIRRIGSSSVFLIRPQQIHDKVAQPRPSARNSITACKPQTTCISPRARKKTSWRSGSASLFLFRCTACRALAFFPSLPLLRSFPRFDAAACTIGPCSWAAFYPTCLRRSVAAHYCGWRRPFRAFNSIPFCLLCSMPG